MIFESNNPRRLHWPAPSRLVPVDRSDPPIDLAVCEPLTSPGWFRLAGAAVGQQCRPRRLPESDCRVLGGTQAYRFEPVALYSPVLRCQPGWEYTELLGAEFTDSAGLVVGWLLTSCVSSSDWLSEALPVTTPDCWLSDLRIRSRGGLAFGSFLGRLRSLGLWPN